MRKLLGVCLVSVSLTLAQCTTTQIQQAEAFIGQVQAATAAACKFIPTVDTIISMVNTGIGQVVGIVTAAICNAVPSPASARYRALYKQGGPATAVGVVNGVQVNGWRV